MTSPPHHCQVILSLAHLLHQHSLSYDDEKDALLSTTVTTSNYISNQYSGGLHSDPHNNSLPKGEVHLVLTGSPRPTFAETNAWLLDVNSTPGKKSSSSSGPKTPIRSSNNNNEQRSESNVSSSTTPGSMRGSYSILDNNVTAMDFEDDNANDNDDDVSMTSSANNNDNNANDDNDDDDGDETTSGGAQLLQEYIAECSHHSTTRNANLSDLGGSPTRLGGDVLLSRYRERKNSEGDVCAGGGMSMNMMSSSSSNVGSNVSVRGSAVGSVVGSVASSSVVVNNDSSTITTTTKTGEGLMVGQAVVNTVNQTKGVGLQSSRAKLLQGTIDRPLWDQRRWTDGECLFSDLIEKCGLKSFENVGGSSSSNSNSGGTLGGGVGAVADAAAGVAAAAAGGIATTPAQQHIKTSILSAHLITVPAENILDGEAIPGMAVGTIEEIARGILRCLKRKKSPPANRVCLILPPVVDKEKEEERRTVALARLKAAFQKLEQYNDMIGAPNLMAEAEFEFVNVSA